MILKCPLSYVQDFAGRRNICDGGTLDRMTHIVAGLVGERLLYRDLTAR